MDDLAFDLDLTTSKAEQNFKNFIKKAETELKRLQQGAEKAMAAPRSTARMRNDDDALKRQREKIRQHNEREAEKMYRYNERMADKAKRPISKAKAAMNEPVLSPVTVAW